MSEGRPASMAPVSHGHPSEAATDLATNQPIARADQSSVDTQAASLPSHAKLGVSITTSPLPSGILFKGKKHKKRVQFRDSNLVNIREIPPRSSSADEESDDDDDSDGSSESDGDTDSDSEEGEVAAVEAVVPVTVPVPVPPKQTVVPGKDKALTLTVRRTSPSPPVSTLTMRPERAPIPWSRMHTYTVAKGSYDVAASPASKVASLVSQITGVSSAATQARVKQRSTAMTTAAAATTSSSPTPKATSPTPGKKSPSVVRVEKKVKKITPTLDNVMTSQTLRSVQKHGAVSESLHKHNGNVKTGKKKRVLQRRQEGNEKRKASSSRKVYKQASGVSKTNNVPASKQASSSSGSKVNGVHTGGKSKVTVVNGLSNARDSLSLPPLSSDDSVLLTPSSKPLQPSTRSLSARGAASVYTMDGFIFPGDLTYDLAAGGVKATTTSSLPGGHGVEREEARLKPQGPSPSLIISGHQAKERVSSAPASSVASRRKRFYAWQMANGNLQNSLHEPPSITPMWETVTPVATLTPKPAFAVADR